MTIKEIMHKYTAGEFTLEQANEELKNAGATFHLDPEKNTLSNEEIKMGFGLLDTGTGSLDKVEVRKGKLVQGGMGEAFALCIIAGKSYEVKNDTLI